MIADFCFLSCEIQENRSYSTLTTNSSKICNRLIFNLKSFNFMSLCYRKRQNLLLQIQNHDYRKIRIGFNDV